MKKLLVLTFAVVLLSCSANDDTPTDNSNNPDPNPTPTTYQLGGLGPGDGLIFYLDSNSQHGLEVGANLGIYNWSPYCELINIPNLQTALGTGLENTNKIVAFFGDSYSYPAKMCLDFEQNGKDDWYLPSKDEVIKIYQFYKSGNCGTYCNFSNTENLWSSSVEYGYDYQNNPIIDGIWQVNLGGLTAYYPDSVIYTESPCVGINLRAIRSF